MALLGFMVGASPEAQAYSKGSHPFNVNANGGIERKFGGGGEIPHPFERVNQKVELADGEKYLLFGKVEFINGRPFLHVNLDLLPWLATHNRMTFPYYALSGSADYWHQFIATDMRITAIAHGVLQANPRGGATYVIVLSPITQAIDVQNYKEVIRVID